MSNNINDIIRLYVRRQATAEQRLQVREYIFDNVDNFNILLKIIREEAMKDMGLSPDDDFLPSLLQERAPEAYAAFPIFNTDNYSQEIISADFADRNDDDDIFAHLCKEILGQPAAWY